MANAVPSSSSFPASGRHVVLLGAMGVGKTEVGRSLAAVLGRPFIDSDAVLTLLTGQDARLIAEADGVARLHRLEARLTLEALAEPQPAVLAPAASVVDSSSVIAALQPHACVWLRASDEVVRARLGSGLHRRKIAPEEEPHIRRRRSLYRDLSGLIIDTGSVDAAAAVAAITDWLGR